MCRYTQGRYSCGHFHQGTALGEGAFRCHKCVPLKVALEYWHRQLQFLPIEGRTGNTLSCPRPCRPIRPFPRGTTGNSAVWQAHNATLQANMIYHGVDAAEQAEILRIEAADGKDSMRALPGHGYPTQAFPENWYNFIKDFEVYQSLPIKEPNIEIHNVARGCGCPRKGIHTSPCLAGWTSREILMLRMKEWNAPPWSSGLEINYGEIQHQGRGDAYSEPVATRFVIPASHALRQVVGYLDQLPPRPVAGINAPATMFHPSLAVPEAEEGSMSRELVEAQVSQTRRRASSLPARAEATARLPATSSPESDGGHSQPAAPGFEGEEGLGVAGRSTASAGQAGPSQPPTAAEDVEEALEQLAQFQLSEASLLGLPHGR